MNTGKFRRAFARATKVVSVISVSSLLAACGGAGGGGGGGGAANNINLWTWEHGSNTVAQAGNYGTEDVADISNLPGARLDAVTWTDKNGNLWLFGGYGYDSAGNGGYGRLNDLWKFNGKRWTWVDGSDAVNQSGVYGVQGAAHVNNVPGARNNAMRWIDRNGNLWLFGGYGNDSAGTPGNLNDLWKFNDNRWTWVAGNNTVSQAGHYGIQGVAHPNNVPGARFGGANWTDRNGNLWLFGGYGHDSAGNSGELNDLWKFDGFQWTWVGGGTIRNQPGTHGTLGVAAPGNVPGSRLSTVTWFDVNGNLWLFGGHGHDSAGESGELNDLWKFDGTRWTWVGGSGTRNQSGTYGTQGVAAPGNVPGGRNNAVGWIDRRGNLWLFSGNGYDNAGSFDYLNDFWMFDGSHWTWMDGSDSVNSFGTYGAQGVADINNLPGARRGAASWQDRGGHFWLFGGYGYDGAGNLDNLNDLWRYQP